MSIFTSIEAIWTKVSAWLTKEKPELDDALVKANNFINIAKTAMGSTAGKTIIAIAEAFAPGAATEIINALANFFTDFNFVSTEVKKAPEQIVADGFNYISGLAGDGKALALSNTAAVAAKAFSDANGGTATIQQISVGVPVVYNPNILTDGEKTAPGTPAAPVVSETPTPIDTAATTQSTIVTG